MGHVVVRSSLERMLDSIRLQDERTEGELPALPARPTLKGRLPSSRKPLAVRFRNGSNAPEFRLLEPEKTVAGLKTGIFGSRRIVEESKHCKIPELKSYEDNTRKTGDPDESNKGSPTSTNLGWSDNDTTNCVLKKIAAVEGARNGSIEGILCIQKCFRALQVRRSFLEFKKGTTTLQSFIRGEKARHEFDYTIKKFKAAVLIQKHVKRWIARKAFVDFKTHMILLQSVIRGSLHKRCLTVLKRLEMTKHSHVKVDTCIVNNLQEMKQGAFSSALEARVLKAEAELKHKEEENTILKQRIQLYETRWSEYESKMKSMEESWQTQLTSLQMSLAAAKKSLLADDIANLPGIMNVSPPDHQKAGSEDDMSSETYIRKPDHQKAGSEDDMSSETYTPQGTRNSKGAKNSVSRLVEEFERRKHNFEDDAGFLSDVKSENPNEDLRDLKVRFAAWTKDYKIRLKETKAEIQNIDKSKPEKARKKWWATSCAR